MFNLIFIVCFALLFWRDRQFWRVTTLTIVTTLIVWSGLKLAGWLP